MAFGQQHNYFCGTNRNGSDGQQIKKEGEAAGAEVTTFWFSFGVSLLKPSPWCASAIAKSFDRTGEYFGKEAKGRKSCCGCSRLPPFQSDLGPAATPPAGSCGFSELKRHFFCGFFNSSTCHQPGVLLSRRPFFGLLLLRQVVSSPHDQHFCCLCFCCYLRSPSCLLFSCLSCIREQLWPVVGLFHCISTSGVSFQCLQSSTMDLRRPEWPMQRAQSYRGRSFCFARVNKNAKLKANPLMSSSNGTTYLTSFKPPSQLTFNDKFIETVNKSVLLCTLPINAFYLLSSKKHVWTNLRRFNAENINW